MRTHANQFPPDYKVPAEVLSLVKAGKLRDSSWGNDVCPHFEADISPAGMVHRRVEIWCDHPVAKLREMKGPRFWVHIVATDSDDADHYLPNAYQGDSVRSAIRVLKSLIRTG